jgi:hypothetical protein
MASTRRPRGAYGLRLLGVEAAHDFLVPAEEGWPSLELVARVGRPVEEPERVTDERAELSTRTGARVVVERRKGRAVFTVPKPVSHEALVHPYLAPAAAVVARWLGRESLHAGAYVVNGGAWAVLGERESGKSTLLAALALVGVEIVCDDLLILDGAEALAAPRSVDLREDAARALGAGEALGVVGARERWRLRLAPASGPATIRGFVFLGWGDRLEALPVPASRRLAGLLHYRALRLPSSAPEPLLDLAALPAWELRRPRDWGSLPAALDLLVGMPG